MNKVEPDSGKIGSVLRIQGVFLGKAKVDEVYLTDHTFDMKVKVLDQTEDSIEFRIPPFVKPGPFAAPGEDHRQRAGAAGTAGLHHRGRAQGNARSHCHHHAARQRDASKGCDRALLLLLLLLLVMGGQLRSRPSSRNAERPVFGAQLRLERRCVGRRNVDRPPVTGCRPIP